MAATNACTLQKTPRRRRCCVSLLNQLSTRLSNDALVGVKCPLTLGCHEPAAPMCAHWGWRVRLRSRRPCRRIAPCRRSRWWCGLSPTARPAPPVVAHLTDAALVV